MYSLSIIAFSVFVENSENWVCIEGIPYLVNCLRLKAFFVMDFEDFLHADVCRMVRHGGRIFAEWLMKLKRWAARDLQEDPGVAFAGTCGRHGTAHPVVHD